MARKGMVCLFVFLFVLLFEGTLHAKAPAPPDGLDRIHLSAVVKG
ncbi:MAG TPA: hypothetical protein PKM41_03545 [Deltaproteobacteria bacterium]|mgnify:CR=1 FL=1|jgi:hypothetical protein|nr:hypothetical protein [Deltaproteobacteria bacterium]HOI06497.1 hypothetical protein [Deltaproteobacteria bacterium]